MGRNPNWALYHLEAPLLAIPANVYLNDAYSGQRHIGNRNLGRYEADISSYLCQRMTRVDQGKGDVSLSVARFTSKITYEEEIVQLSLLLLAAWWTWSEIFCCTLDNSVILSLYMVLRLLEIYFMYLTIKIIEKILKRCVLLQLYLLSQSYFSMFGGGYIR